jgi:glycosyltransferase involved in cell wall biosynthesis
MLPIVNMVVKNEDRFIWYAIKSVENYAEKILITDTGSTDNTVQIIKSIKSKKIVFSEKKINNREELTKIRQDQLRNSNAEWVWIVDGDEIYSDSLCREIIFLINQKKRLEGVVVGRYDLIGDIYHYQDEKVGSYSLFGKKGHIVLRLINKYSVPFLHTEGIYPYEAYYDKLNQEITTHDKKLFAFTKGKIFHAMYLKRSSKGANLKNTYHRNKWKVEIGHKISSSDNFPEVFSNVDQNAISSVITRRSYLYKFIALLITPIKQIKRQIVNNLN